MLKDPSEGSGTVFFGFILKFLAGIYFLVSTKGFNFVDFPRFPDPNATLERFHGGCIDIVYIECMYS